MIIDSHSDPKSISLRCNPSDKWRVDAIPIKTWDKKAGLWVIPTLAPNISHLRANFSRSEFTSRAIDRLRAAVDKLSRPPEKGKFPGAVLPCTMSHQRNALDKAHDKTSFHFAHAMGSGKSLTILTLASYLREKGLEGLLVVCPSTIKHDVWELEVNKWLPQFGIKYSLHVLDSGKHKKALEWIKNSEPEVAVLVVGVQALSNNKGNAYRVAEEFLKSRRSGMAVDEASRIKNDQAARTQSAIALGRLAEWRWCATGTMITQGIHDLYSQFYFLDPSVIGQKSYYTFRNRYCVMGGFENRSIVSYTNTSELIGLVSPHIDIVRKQDANDLPPKTYSVRLIEPSPEQLKITEDLHDTMEASLEDADLEVSTILERMIRYQQIAGGNFPYKDYDNNWSTRPLSSNPKLLELMEVLEEVEGKVIVWAVFLPEIAAISSKLSETYGKGSVVSYCGGVSTDARAEAVDRFQNDSSCRFFVSNQATGGMGLTLTAAETAIFFSNSYSFEDRVQSEDRCHRKGTVNPVLYIDLVMDLPVDRTIRAALDRKGSVASFIANKIKEGKVDRLM